MIPVANESSCRTIKKRGFITAMLVFQIVTAFAQTRTELLDTTEYALLFGTKDTDGSIYFQQKYLDAAYTYDITRFSNLGGTEDYIDTPLEFALLSYYSNPIVDMRPSAADAILPRNRQKQADLKLGAAVFQEMQILGFLARRNALANHERVLAFIIGRGHVSREEIRKYFEDGIRAFISAQVDAQFNNMRIWDLRKANQSKAYEALVYRDPNGRYVLRYQNGTGRPKIITAYSPNSLISEMEKNTDDFDKACRDVVYTNIVNIPTVVFASANVSNDILGTLKDAIARFYLSPNSNYEMILALYQVFQNNAAQHPDPGYFFALLHLNCYNVFSSLSPDLSEKLLEDAGFSIAAAPQNFVRAFQTLRARKKAG